LECAPLLQRQRGHHRQKRHVAWDSWAIAASSVRGARIDERADQLRIVTT
jgi:hypothetical protein